jgi:hypothetical protein
MQDAASYQKLLDYIHEREALEGVKRGLAGVEAGRVTPLDKFAKDSAKANAESLDRWVIERAPLRGPEWCDKLPDSRCSLARRPAGRTARSQCPIREAGSI